MFFPHTIRRPVVLLSTLSLGILASTIQWAPSSWQIGHSAIATPAASAQWSPERRGSSKDTLSGGRRGSSTSCMAQPGQIAPRIQLVVPNDSTGLVTTTDQPTFSWYLETPGPVTMTFVLQDPAVANPIVTKTITASHSGLVNLAPLDSTRLKLGVRYRWSVFVACGDGQQEIVARSFVERLQPGAQSQVQYQSQSH